LLVEDDNVTTAELLKALRGPGLVMTHVVKGQGLGLVISPTNGEIT
jgi:hypothetical protein